MYNIEYKDVNVLEDPNIRIKLSEHSNWPTIPQLFVKGELIGGCDIIVELHNSQELEKYFLEFIFSSNFWFSLHYFHLGNNF